MSSSPYDTCPRCYGATKCSEHATAPTAAFAVGNIVCLVGGGPRMSVEVVDQEITCTWAVGATIHRQTFARANIEHTP